jgi:hypothetical protein
VRTFGFLVGHGVGASLEKPLKREEKDFLRDQKTRAADSGEANAEKEEAEPKESSVGCLCRKRLSGRALQKCLPNASFTEPHEFKGIAHLNAAMPKQ